MISGPLPISRFLSGDVLIGARRPGFGLLELLDISKVTMVFNHPKKSQFAKSLVHVVSWGLMSGEGVLRDWALVCMVHKKDRAKTNRRAFTVVTKFFVFLISNNLINDVRGNIPIIIFTI